MQEQTSLRSSILACCKNHPDIPSRYFVTEQPWIKYCKECALNVALCGRNISQDFSTDEFQRKMHISSVVNELKRNAQQAQQNNSQYEQLMSMFQECSKPLTDRIHDIDRSIRDLIQVRDKLQQIYDKEIVGRINNLLEKQSRMSLSSREIKNELQVIESNFSTFIQKFEKHEFDKKVSHWTEMNKTARSQFIQETEFNRSKDRLLNVMEFFYTEIQKLANFTLNLPFDIKQACIPEDTFSMVLTPIDSNSLAASLASDNNAEKKTKKQLKLRCHKNQTDRQIYTNKKNTKRASISIPQTQRCLQQMKLTR